MKRYRVLRPGVSQRQAPDGPIVECEVGAIVEIGDEMAEYLMREPEPYIESSSKRRRTAEQEGD